jgi:hypothetical protein
MTEVIRQSVEFQDIETADTLCSIRANIESSLELLSEAVND